MYLNKRNSFPAVHAGILEAIKGLSFAVSLLLFFGSTGCVSSKRFSDPYKETGYSGYLSDWTRETRIYNGLDHELTVAATFKSAQYRNAFTEEYTRLYKLNAAEKDKLVKDQREAAETYNDFILAAYASEDKTNDFNKRDSIWK